MLLTVQLPKDLHLIYQIILIDTNKFDLYAIIL